MKTIDQLDAADRRRLTGPGLRAFWNLARLWSLTEHEQMILLGISSRSTLRHWQRGQITALRRESLGRLSLIFGIFRAIGELFGATSLADEWIRLPNRAALFGGRSALDNKANEVKARRIALRRREHIAWISGEQEEASDE